MINPINNVNNIDEFKLKTDAKKDESEEFEHILQKALSEKDDRKLKAACQNLESVFVNMMFQKIKSTVIKSEFMGNSFAEDMYEDMLFEKYAEKISEGKGIGLGDMLYNQLRRNHKEKSEE